MTYSPSKSPVQRFRSVIPKHHPNMNTSKTGAAATVESRDPLRAGCPKQQVYSDAEDAPVTSAAPVSSSTLGLGGLRKSSGLSA